MSTTPQHHHPARRILGGLLGLALSGTALLTAGHPAAAAPHHPVGADFNGDGYADLVIGAPGETTSGFENAGRLHVVYGKAAGLDVPGSTWFSQATGLVQGEPEYRDFFGQVLETGDFDGDGYDDLAIGVPQEDIGNIFDAGAVQVLYGSAKGLTVDGNQLFSLATAGITGNPSPGDGFGTALAAADLDGDGHDDLVVGAPHDAGFLVTIPGTSSGLDASGAHNFTYSGGTDHRALGTSLAAADFDKDGHEDVLVGAPGEDVAGKTAAGRVYLLRGDAFFGSFGSSWTSYDQQLISNKPEAFAQFGKVVAAGRLGSDGRPDIAIGVPTDAGNDEGAVVVVPGTAGDFPLAAGAYTLRLDTMGIAGVTGQSSGYFGSSLAIGDVNGDGKGDLAVGAPGQDDGLAVRDGLVTFVPGNINGLAKLQGKVLRQSSAGVPGDPSSGEQWGSALAVSDPNGDGKPSLVIGAAFDDIDGVDAAGSVTIVPPKSPWPPTANLRFLSENVPNFPDDAELGDWFGEALA